jgi:hypothetical protein
MNTIAEQVRTAFPFNVTREPLYSGDGATTHYHGLFRDDTGEPVSRHSVCSGYEPHTTDDIVALVEAASEAFGGGDAVVRARFSHGHQVIVAPSNSHRQAIFGTRDNLFARVNISAGYDGRAVQASLNAYRDACRNLMMLRKVAGVTQTIRHTSNLRPEMDDLIETFGYLAARWNDVGNAAREMEQREVRLVGFLDRIYGQPDERSLAGITRHRNRTEAIVRRLFRERMQTGRPDLGNEMIVTGWEAYNAVQGYHQHDATRRGNPSDIERALLALDNQQVAKAERLVYEMAL